MQRIYRLIKEKESFLITSHIHPDGDAIGCQIAFSMALEEMGKRVYIFNQDPVPWRYQKFSRVNSIKASPPPQHNYEAILILDAANLSRIGKVKDTIQFEGRVVVNIDHHISNEKFGEINIVKPEYSSTAEIIYEILKPLCVISPQMAELLYMGIATDTGAFRYPNTTAHTLRTAAKLIDIGVDPSDVASNIWFSDRPERVKLLGEVLETLKIRDGYAVMFVTMDMLKKYRADEEETEEFVDYGLTIEGIQASIFLKERANRMVKVSLRSKSGTDVNTLAVLFGGGGHSNAAGFIIKGTIEDVMKKIESKIGKIL
jgi:phosphoesterase RecJ-like protein